jgi:hypothetical protein
MTAFAVGPDAGLDDRNVDAALVADFLDEESWRRYQDDPRHLAVIAEHVKPWLEARTAVQFEV